MTQEQLKKAKAIDDEIRALSLANIGDAKNIVPIGIDYSYYSYSASDGRNRQGTTTVILSDKFRQTILKAIEDRVEYLKCELARL